ncbi:MAG: hypothetical protein HY040_18350 [Planctomycetes bacterium]|nr:hypothetical protein [Planctomycetota bacterium]
MEIFEIAYALIQACGCLLDFFALGSGVGAGVAGVKANQQRKAGKEARARGEDPPKNKATLWFVLLLFGTFFFVGLMVLKYVRAMK